MRVALITLAVTRAGVWVVAIAAQSLWGRNAFDAALYDLKPATHPFGWEPANAVASALARWDAVWYLLIANRGYAGPHGIPSPTGDGLWGASINFFPGYPMLVRAVSGVAASPALVLVAAYVISLAAFAVALYLLYRLALLEVGRSAATWSVVLLAVFPGAVFFGTPYAESVFLALSVAALYAARTGRWPVACALAAAAAVTRLPGILLVMPLAVFYWDGRRRIGRDAAWLLLVPAVLLGYFAYCWHLTGDALAYIHIGETFGRGISDPVSALTGAFRASSDAFETIVFGAHRHPGESAFRFADLTGLLAFLAAVGVTIGVLRNLPRPYGAYCAASLLVILCTGPSKHPLVPALRYTAVVFPLFIELGRLAARKEWVGWATGAAMGFGLALTASLYSRWLFLG